MQENLEEVLYEEMINLPEGSKERAAVQKNLVDLMKCNNERSSFEIEETKAVFDIKKAKSDRIANGFKIFGEIAGAVVPPLAYMAVFFASADFEKDGYLSGSFARSCLSKISPKK